MKTLMKFIVTLIVICVVAFVVGYLVMNSKNNVNVPSSGDEIIKQESGENNEIIEPENKVQTKEEIISEIEKQVNAINHNSVIKEFDEKITEEEASASIKDFMNYFKVKDVQVTIKVKNGCIEVIPYSDFVENMVYYFDGAGNLIMFESVSTTVGGSCKYYFNDGELIDVVVAYEEEVDVTPENASDILNRANKIYEKYNVKEKIEIETKNEVDYDIVFSGENFDEIRSGE